MLTERMDTIGRIMRIELIEAGAEELAGTVSLHVVIGTVSRGCLGTI